ncbi:MAG: LysM peptidoglycan-binding domain-containing protein [Verrucomicrobiae bacterium]|nr:LysM peptidoglycan-binding domain-containing protein [Verrucomicrobiae bacterium]MCP5543763.1 LysM peptidoglycan-binding domain-containing protein [Akkermansiaceae bacterium]MCP5546567.1 LysM peptidoglycan-binding domain-containing protein [Akkermansiaceae bacterium]
MKTTHLFLSAAIAAALVSCASQGDNEYDTPGNPYDAADASMVNPPVDPNPVYDSPAAYGDAGSVDALAPAVPQVPPAPAIPDPTPSVPATGPATIHTVVKGDTLSGISSKYNVPMAAIKAANNMTSDTVVLGRKMVIPPR